MTNNTPELGEQPPEPEQDDTTMEGNLIRTTFMIHTPLPLLPAQFLSLRAEKVQEVLATLTAGEKELIIQQCGIGPGTSRTVDLISRATLRQRPSIEKTLVRGYRKLRHPSRSDLLRPFVPLEEKSIGKQVWNMGFGCELLSSYPHLDLSTITADGLDLSFPTTAELLSHIAPPSRFALTNTNFSQEKLVRLIMEQTKSPLSPDTQIELRASLQRLENQHQG